MPLSADRAWPCVQKYILVQVGTLRVCTYAIWINECASYILAPNQPGAMGLSCESLQIHDPCSFSLYSISRASVLQTIDQE